MSRRHLLAAAAAAATTTLALAACGPSAAPIRSPAELRAADPATLLDPASFAVANLDLGALRASPHAPGLEALLEELRGMGGGAPGFEAILGDTDRILLGVALPPGQQEPTPTLVLVGTATPDRFASALGRELGPGAFEVDADAEPWTARGEQWTLVHDGVGLAVVSDRTAEQVLLARWNAPGPSPLAGSPALTDAARLAGMPGGVLSVAVAPGDVPRELVDEDDDDWQRWGRHLLALGARLDLLDGLSVVVTGRFDAPTVAADWVAYVRGELAKAQRNLLLDLLLGIRPLLAATHASGEGDVARVETRLPAGDTDRLIASLRSVVGYADRALEALREEGRGGAPDPRTGAPLESRPPALEEDAAEPGEP